MKVYIVIGETKNVYQDKIGEEFVPHPDKEIVSVFYNNNDAKEFVANSKLAKPKKERYGDTSYYRGGYYNLEIESHEVE